MFTTGNVVAILLELLFIEQQSQKTLHCFEHSKPT